MPNLLLRPRPMNFFEQQHQARQNTRILVMLFVLAVGAIVLAVNGMAVLVWRVTHGAVLSGPLAAHYPNHFFLTNTVLTVGLISAGTLIELLNLRDGGDKVAEMVGGRLVSRATNDLQERRLLNVVDEMAIAAHLTCPRVYLLAREDGINAFAAGYNPHEAVIAVTNGALTRLTRDELQGIVAHEFSHILNGDMRLNMRLIGVLFGIQMVAGFGQTLMQWSPNNLQRDAHDETDARDEKQLPVHILFFVTGLTLFVIGYIGIVFGRLIKAAVSREREFLADASAVQFTRNSDGIGTALQKIGGHAQRGQPGSQIVHVNAEQLSHLFLGAVKSYLADGLFATHPPITERLRRIFGRTVELLDAPVLQQKSVAAPMLPDLLYAPKKATGLAVDEDKSSSSAAATATLHTTVHDPQSARAVVYALLIESAPMQDVQRNLLDSCEPPQSAIVAALLQQIQALPPTARLPLLDLAVPALRQLSLPQRATHLSMVNRLIAADQRITLNEFVLQTILVRRLDPLAGRAVPVRYANISAVRDEWILILSLVSHVAGAGNAGNAGNASNASHTGLTQSARHAFAQGLAASTGVQLCEADLVPVTALDFDKVRLALDRLVQLAPLGKPALIKALVAAARQSAQSEQLTQVSADIVRAICCAIDAPLPPIVAASYRPYQSA